MCLFLFRKIFLPLVSMYLIRWWCNYYIDYIFFTGRQFFQAEEVLYSARHTSYGESLEAGIQCFLLSIEVSVGAVFQYGTVLN